MLTLSTESVATGSLVCRVISGASVTAETVVRCAFPRRVGAISEFPLMEGYSLVGSSHLITQGESRDAQGAWQCCHAFGSFAVGCRCFSEAGSVRRACDRQAEPTLSVCFRRHWHVCAARLQGRRRQVTLRQA